MSSTLYRGTTNARIDEMEYQVHGIFAPGSIARAIRTENALLGLKTCGYTNCMRAYRPQRIWLPGGKLFRPGRGRFYCSRECMVAEREHRAQLYDDLAEEYPDIRATMLATEPWYFA